MNKPNIKQHLLGSFFALAIVGALLALPKAEATITEVVGGLHSPRGLAFAPGGQLFVAQTGDDTVAGTIVARLPHQYGARYQIALESDWSSLCPSFPAEVEIAVSSEPSTIIGSVGEGSTDVTIEFGPLRPLRMGSPVTLDTGEGILLYQVASLRLQVEAWAGASSVVPHATARQIGLPRGGHVAAQP